MTVVVFPDPTVIPVQPAMRFRYAGSRAASVPVPADPADSQTYPAIPSQAEVNANW